MKKNLDAREIVIDSEMFDKLMEFADIGADSTDSTPELDLIKKHVRKFNVNCEERKLVAARIEQSILDAKQMRLKRKRTARLVSSRYKIEYSIEEGAFTIHKSYTIRWFIEKETKLAHPIYIKGKSSAWIKDWVSIEFLKPINTLHSPLSYYTSCNVDCIAETLEEIPEGYSVVRHE